MSRVFRILFIYGLWLAAHSALAVSGPGGVQGTITTEDGETLPYSTIYVRNIQTGTSSNAEGFYRISLDPGKYDLVFQYMGYETSVQFVEVGQTFLELNITLKPQIIVLNTVEITARDEDPSYTVIRKAIAKAKYHTQIIDTMSARVYIKGSGRLISAPFFARNQLKKEGIDSTSAFIQESVSIIKYKRPNTIEEQVISIRTIGDAQNQSPNAYINGSFYEPEIAGAISPLSPRAFAYYIFEHQGTFFDRGVMVNKIKVIPRSKGDDIFWGFIYIVEDSWAIHSLDLKATKLGINFHLRQICDQIEPNIWLPVNHNVEGDGKILGFDFEFQYLVSVSDFYIELNPELDFEFEVIDEKVNPELAKELKPKLDIKTAQLEEKLANGNEITRKELRKVLKEYEQMELEEFEMPDILQDYKMVIDSTAYDFNPSYWAEIRPIPLSKYEVRGYEKMDSMAVAEKEEQLKDSLKAERKKNFHVEDLLLGNSYRITDQSRFRIKPFLENLGFNSVEGYNLTYGLRYDGNYKGRKRLSFGPDVRYSFARNKVTGRGVMEYRFGERLTPGRIYGEGGKYVVQYNHAEPIHPIVNSFMSLLFSKNYMKIYERDYGLFGYEKKLSPKFNFTLQLEWEQRMELNNNTSHTWINYEDYSYQSNSPENDELISTGFPRHQAAIIQLGFDIEPWLKFRIVDDQKIPARGRSPVFSMKYRKGIRDLFKSDVDFDLLEIKAKYDFKIGIRGKVDAMVNAGIFINDDQMSFIDYVHYLGNRTPITTLDPAGSFRLLDYYQHSTNDKYFTGHVHYQFRRFLFTQMFLLRAAGIRENIFVNHLEAPTANHYTEFGYSIDYILRIFRLEFVSSFQNGSYRDFGVRIGIASNLDDIFSGN